MEFLEARIVWKCCQLLDLYFRKKKEKENKKLNTSMTNQKGTGLIETANSKNLPLFVTFCDIFVTFKLVIQFKIN